MEDSLLDSSGEVEDLVGSGLGKAWVISSTPPLTSRPRSVPATKLGRLSWQCFTIFSTACWC